MQTTSESESESWWRRREGLGARVLLLLSGVEEAMRVKSEDDCGGLRSVLCA